MNAKNKLNDRYLEIRNAKVHHEYFLLDKWEAGIVLQGTEVKSVRAGKAQIADAFVRLERLEPVLYHAHIEEYKFGNCNNHNPVRPRKLLLHKREIESMYAATRSGGYSLVPTRIYFKGSLLKIEIALCKGKKLHDKRASLKEKISSRETDRAIRERF
jgi:SsrA-binding protein